MRKLILENIREALENKVVSRDYIFINRGIDSDAKELPLVNINSISEDVQEFNVSPRSYRRNLIVAIECGTTGNSSSEVYEILESMIEATEQMIESNNWLNSKERTMKLNRIEYSFEGEGDIPQGWGILYYNVERESDAQDFDQSCLDVLKQVNIDYRVTDNNEDNAIDAQDEFSGLEL